MERPHSRLLRQNRQRLIENIEIKFSPLWDHLVAKNVISRRHVEQMKIDFRSNAEQVGEFIDYLTRRPHHDYLAFREALVESDQGHVVHDSLPEDGRVTRVGIAGDSEHVGPDDASGTARLPIVSLPHMTHSASAKAIRDIRKKIRDLPPVTDYKRCTQQFKETKENSERCYKMQNDVRGRALVVTMTGDREGWEVDVIKVAELMKYLDIDAQFMFDLKYDDLVRSLAEFSQSSENSYVDCVWVVIMGHGSKMTGEDYLGTADAKTFFVRKEMEIAFDNNKCLGLRGKPKVILIQMCRGDEFTRAVDELERLQVDAKIPPRLAPFEDYIISYATQPGKVAIRNTVSGSWYINELVEVFKDMADHTAVPEMFEEVHRRVRSLVDIDKHGRAKVQTAEATLSLTRRFYLFPRVYEDAGGRTIDVKGESSKKPFTKPVQVSQGSADVKTSTSHTGRVASRVKSFERKEIKKEDKNSAESPLVAKKKGRSHVAELANPDKKKVRARVTFSYTPENEDELRLEVGETVEIIKKEEEGWWEAVSNGKTGMIPSNFVEIVDGSAETVDHNAMEIKKEDKNAAESLSVAKKEGRSHVAKRANKLGRRGGIKFGHPMPVIMSSFST